MLDLDCMSPKTKFIYDTFANKKDNAKSKYIVLGESDNSKGDKIGNNIVEGEQIKDVFACAIQLKILIQGKLYVSS